MTAIGDTENQSVTSGFIMAFLCILAFCFVMNYYIGHKFHVSASPRPKPRRSFT